MTQPSDAAAPSPRRDVTWAGLTTFLLLGWANLLIPSSIRDIEQTFGQTDAGMGLAYLLNNLLYVTGTLSVGWLAARLWRAPVLGAGPGLIAAGLLVIAVAPSWPVFLAGFVALGLGAGLIDSGVNALFMDLYEGRAAGALNRLHLFFALGALASPLAAGIALSNGVPWQTLAVATAAVAVPIGLLLATRTVPPVHPPLPEGDAAGEASRDIAREPVKSPGRRALPLPLIALAVAIAAYVASEIGVSNWLVRYLDEAPVAQATLALSLFWGGLALGRFVSSLIADRMGPVRYAVTWATAAGIAIIASLFAPSIPLAIVCFAVAGFAAGPVYPMIVAIGGLLYPGRSSMVSGVLVSAAMVGSLIYPPLMGVLSGAVGLRAGMFGAGLVMLVSAAAILVAARLAGRLGSGVAADEPVAVPAGH